MGDYNVATPPVVYVQLNAAFAAKLRRKWKRRGPGTTLNAVMDWMLVHERFQLHRIGRRWRLFGYADEVGRLLGGGE